MAQVHKKYLQAFLYMHEGQEKKVNVEEYNLAGVVLFLLATYSVAFVAAVAVMSVKQHVLNP